MVEWRPEEDVMNWMENLSQKTDARGEALSATLLIPFFKTSAITRLSVSD